MLVHCTGLLNMNGFIPTSASCQTTPSDQRAYATRWWICYNGWLQGGNPDEGEPWWSWRDVQSFEIYIPTIKLFIFSGFWKISGIFCAVFFGGGRQNIYPGFELVEFAPWFVTKDHFKWMQLDVMNLFPNFDGWIIVDVWTPMPADWCWL